MLLQHSHMWSAAEETSAVKLRLFQARKKRRCRHPSLPKCSGIAPWLECANALLSLGQR